MAVIDTKTLRFLKAKVQSIYRPFFANLQTEGKNSPGLGALFLAVFEDLRRLEAVINRMQTAGVTVATVNDAVILDKLTQSVESKKEKIISLIASERINQAYDNLDMAKEELSFSAEFARETKEQKVSSKTEAPLTQEGLSKAVRRGITGGALRATGVGLGLKEAKGLIDVALGPYSLLGYGAVGLGALGARGIGAAAKRIVGRRGKVASIPSSPSLRMSGDVTEVQGLQNFFDKGWKKATWTKDIHSMLKKMSGGKVSGKGPEEDLGGKILEMLGIGALGKSFMGLLPKLATLTAGLGVSAAGAYAAYNTFKLIKMLPEWKEKVTETRDVGKESRKSHEFFLNRIEKEGLKKAATGMGMTSGQLFSSIVSAEMAVKEAEGFGGVTSFFEGLAEENIWGTSSIVSILKRMELEKTTKKLREDLGLPKPISGEEAMKKARATGRSHIVGTPIIDEEKIQAKKIQPKPKLITTPADTPAESRATSSKEVNKLTEQMNRVIEEIKKNTEAQKQGSVQIHEEKVDPVRDMLFMGFQ